VVVRDGLPSSRSEKRSQTPFEALAQHAVLGLQVLNNNELLTADPASEQKDDEGQREGFRCMRRV
jgi:hypothetical protein